ncbi:MAG: phenylacetate--CoA ligase [bacterium]|jgi:phenylacetate-CoA ligase|nr:phenylacetate--CoA ligase [bacterium]
MIWNPEMECMPVAERRALQFFRLKNVIRKCYENVPCYQKKFEEKGITPDDIKSLEDIRKLPFTSKIDLRDNYPFGMFAVPMEEIVRVHSSSGTTGKPVVVGYTRQDVDTWAETMARTLACAGGCSHDIIQVAYGYGLFTGGLGAHYGAEKLGATVVPISGGNTQRQVMLLQDFGSTMLACTPSYSLCIAEACEEMGIDTAQLKLKAGVFGAEPWSNAMREEIEKRLHIKAIDIYGLSEIIGPGVSSECLEQKGLHVFDDHFYPEIIDPETEEPLPPGVKGELVFTSLTKQAFPVLRFRTRDITCLIDEPCACGRTHVRMERVSGRTDDMLIIRGVNVFPSQIEEVLVNTRGVEPHYLILVDRVGALDTLTVQVEVEEKIFSDEVRRLEELQKDIQKDIESMLGLSCKIQLVEPKTIERSQGKAKRVIDRRKERQN